jgi:hypothetical protein
MYGLDGGDALDVCAIVHAFDIETVGSQEIVAVAFEVADFG